MGPSNRQGASMRSLRKAARTVAVFHLPCGTRVDEALSLRRPAAKPCHVGLGPGLIDEDQTPGINAPLGRRASACDGRACVRAILFTRDDGP